MDGKPDHFARALFLLAMAHSAWTNIGSALFFGAFVVYVGWIVWKRP